MLLPGHAMLRVVLPYTHYAEALRRAVASDSSPVGTLSCARMNIDQGEEWLLGISSTLERQRLCHWRLLVTDTIPGNRQWARWFAEMQGQDNRLLLVNTRDGQVLAMVRDANAQVRQVDELWLNGPGMAKFSWPHTDSGSSIAMASSRDWSRLQGALGEGTHGRLRSLRPAIIGVSRNGSLIASTLARMGVERFVLIDPDHIEEHHLDVMDGATREDIGDHKVAAVARELAAIGVDPENILSQPSDIATAVGIRSLKQADLLICCVDDDAARLTTGVLAHHMGRPLLDIGSGVFLEQSQRRMGGDTRLILPGESRCLACMGGVRRINDLDNALHYTPRGGETLWNNRRSGSLRSLNQINVHLGVRLLEELVDLQLQSSTWLHFEWTSGETPSLTTVDTHTTRDCCICSSSGGDAALQDLRQDVLMARHQIRQRLALSATDIHSSNHPEN